MYGRIRLKNNSPSEQNSHGRGGSNERASILKASLMIREEASFERYLFCNVRKAAKRHRSKFHGNPGAFTESVREISRVSNEA